MHIAKCNKIVLGVCNSLTQYTNILTIAQQDVKNNKIPKLFTFIIFL